MPQPRRRNSRTQGEQKHVLDYFTFAVIVVAAVGAGFAAWYTRQQFLTAQDTEQRQLRAYIFIQGGGVKLTDDQSGVQAVIQVQNYGQTPGYDFETWTKIEIGQVGGNPYGVTGTPKQKSIIGPSADFNVPSDRLTFCPGELAAVRAGSAVIFVWGSVRYTDAFGRCWEFVFRDSVTGPDGDLRDRETKQVAGKGWGLSPNPRYGYTETEKQCADLSEPP
jgi:hypothetical protein